MRGSIVSSAVCSAVNEGSVCYGISLGYACMWGFQSNGRGFTDQRLHVACGSLQTISLLFIVCILLTYLKLDCSVLSEHKRPSSDVLCMWFTSFSGNCYVENDG